MVKVYAVNCNDAWLIPDDEPKEGHYVKYEDYAALKEAVENYIDNMDHQFDCEYSLCRDPRIALTKILGRSLSDMQ